MCLQIKSDSLYGTKSIHLSHVWGEQINGQIIKRSEVLEISKVHVD